MIRLALACCLVPAFSAAASDAIPHDLVPVRIAVPVSGHIHPAICRSKSGTLVVIYGRVNHRDLRITRSTDGGESWSEPTPFVHTVGKTYYPGSLTTLADGRLLHCWNRWSEPTNEKEPRSVVYSLSADDGLTWSDPEAFPRDEAKRSVIRHPIVELAPNRWLVSLDDRTFLFDPQSKTATPFGDGRLHGLVPIVRTPQGTLVSGAALRSTDEGKSWEQIADYPNLKENGWRYEMIVLGDGLLLATEILGPGFGGERLCYRISTDDGRSWPQQFVFYDPGRPIGGRACPRTVQLDNASIGTVFYDIDAGQRGGPGLFFLRIPLGKLKAATTASPKGT